MAAPKLKRGISYQVEPDRSGFTTTEECHPINVVPGGVVQGTVGIKELREAIPPHCFEPTLARSFLELGRDLLYTALLTCFFFFTIPKLVEFNSLLYYPLMAIYGLSQGIVWTGLWIQAHECGHSAFSKYSMVNDAVGWTLHSWLLTPYFSWKSTHRRHHIYANHVEEDHNYVPPKRDQYLAKLGLKPGQFDELTEDAPAVLFIRIIIQQLIGWNWYILTNITCPPTALAKPYKSAWRNSHFDPWGSLFRESERLAILLSDLGCFMTIAALYVLETYLGSWSQVFWFYVVPWTWTNHWIVMITYLHHTHPSIPKFDSSHWTFILGATATMDRDFGLIGTHFFHRISSDHVVHHLFSKIPHYFAHEATNAIVPLLGKSYKRGGFGWEELKLSFSKCQWVEDDSGKDEMYFGDEAAMETVETSPVVGMERKLKRGLWYRSGPSPAPEFRQRVEGDEGGNVLSAVVG
ncbi:hypothetical protein PMZ80_005947 [Knufia obscura]|uniref:Fatty acid desaturase domain-containing protein n=2 Tax=Knufia TaxID=430999 RepID=A0AAN8EFV2_9EURO|nr:hypothetical protein PMZ80_005947 [Knufia obscura]KAK5954618.1 hypothetical protein OHC33_004340 [Knufia fluminis]